MRQAAIAIGEGEFAPERLTAANINPRTGLATDYLNHFNEVVMLLEMLPDMPDCVEDVLGWAPLDYVGHFQRSSFAEKRLAIEAYAAVDRAVRAHLETIVAAIDEAVADIQALLREEGAAACAQAARRATDDIRPLIAAANGAIHGGAEAAESDDVQAGVDALFG